MLCLMSKQTSPFTGSSFAALSFCREYFCVMVAISKNSISAQCASLGFFLHLFSVSSGALWFNIVCLVLCGSFMFALYNML